MQKHQSLLEMVRKSDRVWPCLKRGLTEIGGKEKRSRSIRDFKLGLEHRMRSDRQDQVVRLAKDLFCKRPQHQPPEALPRVGSNYQQLHLLLADDRFQLLPNFAASHDEFMRQLRQRPVLLKLPLHLSH